MRYTVVLTPDETEDGSAISVRVPAMPGVFTWGATEEEAITSAREAIELSLEQYVERGKPFPRDRGADIFMNSAQFPPPRIVSIEVELPARRAAS